MGEPLGWEDPLEEGMQPTPVLLLRESHGQEPGDSPRGQKELDTTEWLSAAAGEEGALLSVPPVLEAEQKDINSSS